ncbi:FecR family protein [Flagellimonas flava]|nr:FecR domain-containing protein [Allomuricauda flava]
MQDKNVLIEKFLSRTISKKERKILKKWVLQNKENLSVFRAEIRKRSEGTLYHHFDGSQAFESFLDTINKKQTRTKQYRSIFRYAAMVALLLTVGYITYQYNVSEEPQQQLTNTSEKELENNIVISLADGTQQVVTTDSETLLTDKNGNIVAKKEGQGLDFSGQQSTVSKPVFNEIYVPYGQTFKLTLSDGTKVWLNAGTRLRFPQNLKTASQNRVVYLEGEAFFDVTKDKKRPFIVNAQNIDIRVLGTQFNVSAYESDDNIATTLVEGAVNVYENSNPDTKIALSPNYQASFLKGNGVFEKQKVDTRIFTSWMERKLIIDNLSFGQILKKLERSHNVTIVNNASHLNNEIFKGEFDNERIENILNTIASSTPFNYTIQNNVITISK